MLKYIHNIIFPALPSLQSRQLAYLEATRKSLHLLELQHLDTVAAQEHYLHYKQELLCRIARLQLDQDKPLTPEG